jgi:uncharacterized membrane protein
MQNKTIDLNAAVKTGWQIATQNLFFFFVILLALFLINVGENFIQEYLTKHSSVISTICYVLMLIIFYFFNLLVGLGFIKISLDFVRNKKPKFSDIFSNSNLVVKYFIISLLVAIITIAPTVIPMIAFGITFAFEASAALNIVRIIIGAIAIAGVIFTVYLSLKFMFVQYALVDKNSGIIESLKLSSQITRGVKWQLVLFGFISLGIMILGVLALVVGLFVAIPITMIATAAIYLQLAGLSAAADKPAAST